MATVFEVGSFWFWTVSIAFTLWLLVSVRFEHGWSSTSCVVLFAVLLWLCGSFNVFKWICLNPLIAFTVFVGYVFVGIGLSYTKWYFRVADYRDAYKKLRDTFIRLNRLTDTIPPDFLSKFQDYIRNCSWDEFVPRGYSRPHHVNSLQDVIPKAADHKNSLIFWTSFWPISLFWTLFHDILDRLFQRIYQALRESYDHVARHAFRNIPDDFKTETK
jgi:hypothetical protein